MTATSNNIYREFLGTKKRDVRREYQFAQDLEASSALIQNGNPVAAVASPNEQISGQEQAIILSNALERLPDNYQSFTFI